MFYTIVFAILAIVLVVIVVTQALRTKNRGGSSIFPGSTAADRGRKRKHD